VPGPWTRRSSRCSTTASCCRPCRTAALSHKQTRVMVGQRSDIDTHFVVLLGQCRDGTQKCATDYFCFT
jgi:hypothetical protein